MPSKILSLALAATCLTACSTPTPQADRNSHMLGDLKVHWSAVLKHGGPLDTHHAAIVAGLGPSENVYLFGAHYPADVTNRPVLTTPGVQISGGSTYYGAKSGCKLAYLTRRDGSAPKPKHIRRYNECLAKAPETVPPPPTKPKRPRRSLSELITLAERAVTAEGSCQWLGYDRALDRRMRSGLLSQTDERGFFARLRCP